MTALTGTEQKLEGFQMGAVDYITKPLQQEELLARVTTHLRLRELNERLEQKVVERTRELIAANQQLEQEIAERKRAEKALWETKELFKKTFMSLRDAIFLLDAAVPPIILDCNPVAMEMFGYDRQEMRGRTTAFLHVDKATLKIFE